MKHRFIKIILTVLSVTAFFATGFNVLAANEQGSSVASPEIPYETYSYWTDINTEDKVPVYSKPMYSVEEFIYAIDLGGSEDSFLNDVECYNKNVYLLDGGLGKIYILDNNYKLSNVIDSVNLDGEQLTFVGAKGIYIDTNGYIYLADTNNQRVIVCDTHGNVIELLLLPESPLIPTGFVYKPVKVAVDGNGYVYVVSEGSYYGAILYSPEKDFLGFFGANTVKATVKTALNNLWNRLFSNDVKRAADKLSLPYTINDLTIGPQNFVYTATGHSEQRQIQTGQICMYNPGGTDVLNAEKTNFADYELAKNNLQLVTQNVLGIDMDDNGYMYVLDGAYGRIYLYDSGLNNLSVFGGSIAEGSQKGTFGSPNAIALNGDDVIVTDSKKNGFAVFKITEYGSLFKKANSITLTGDFAAARTLWEQVLKQDSNNQLAYRGVAKALYDEGLDKEAMEYARMGYDRDTYDMAFKNVRNAWIEEHFPLLAFGLTAVISIAVAFVIVKRKKGLVLVRNPKVKTLTNCVVDPVESFRELKEKKTGSVIAASVLLVIFYVVTVLSDILGGFVFIVFDSETYNSFYVFLRTVGLVFLWTVSNWLVCTLLGGIGKIKEIFTVTCYCLIPVIIEITLSLIFSHILVKDESAFVGIMVYAFILYAAFMLSMGMMKIHDYEFGKFVLTTILTILAMIIIVFLIFLVFMMVQQLFGWIVTVYSELT